MLMQPVLDKLGELRLVGMRCGLEQQLASAQYAELSFEERLGLLVDQEWTQRQDTRFRRRVTAARLAQSASIEDLEITPRRGLDRGQVLSLATCDWIDQQLGVIVLGPTGTGKSFLACALGHAACRQGRSVRYERLARLLETLALAHADGSFLKLLEVLGRLELLILDDWLRDPLTPAQTRDLLEVLEDRVGRRSTVVATQVPVEQWHSRLGDPTLADAVLDRLVHTSHRLILYGAS